MGSIINWLKDQGTPSFYWALWIISTLSSGEDDQSEPLINEFEILTIFSDLLSEWISDNLAKEILFTLSNFCGGFKYQILSSGIFDRIIFQASSGSKRARKEAILCIWNLACKSDYSTIESLVNNDVIQIFSEFLNFVSSPDTESVIAILDSVYSILHTIEKDMVLYQIEETGLLQEFETLQNHPNQRVYQKAVQILEENFELEELEESLNQEPVTGITLSFI